MMQTRKEIIEQIMAGIGAMKHKMHFKVMQRGKNNRITHSQWCVLTLVEKHQNVGVKEISKMLGITSSATTQLVDGLVASNYVARKVNAGDRRSLQLCLSKKGKKHITSAKAMFTSSMEKLFKPLSDKELEAYNGLHKKILNSIS